VIVSSEHGDWRDVAIRQARKELRQWIVAWLVRLGLIEDD
jgi:hypothetical protein